MVFQMGLPFDNQLLLSMLEFVLMLHVWFLAENKLIVFRKLLQLIIWFENKEISMEACQIVYLL